MENLRLDQGMADVTCRASDAARDANRSRKRSNRLDRNAAQRLEWRVIRALLNGSRHRRTHFNGGAASYVVILGTGRECRAALFAARYCETTLPPRAVRPAPASEEHLPRSPTATDRVTPQERSNLFVRLSRSASPDGRAFPAGTVIALARPSEG